MASEDDEYNGYFIPKGTVVLGNAWYAFHPPPPSLNHQVTTISRAILHDPTAFSEPLEYRPERYLKDGQLDPNTRNPGCAVFGFGPR